MASRCCEVKNHRSFDLNGPDFIQAAFGANDRKQQRRGGPVPKMTRESLPDGTTEDVHESRESQLLDRLRAPIRSSSANPAMFLTLDGPLVELISVSRSGEGRAKLAELRTVPSLLILLDQFHLYSPESSSSAEFLDILHLLLKLARNLCAGDSTNQDAFFDSGGVAILVSITAALLSSVPGNVHKAGDGVRPSDDVHERDSILERVTARFGSTAISSQQPQGHVPVSRPVRCLQMMLQLLGNFSRRGEENRAAVWDGFFPGLLLELTTLRVREIFGPLCMVLITCCQGNGKRCWQLCQGDGAALIDLLMVSTMDNNSECAVGNGSSSQEQIEWFELVVQHLCLEQPLFPLLFTNLGVPPLGRELDHLTVRADEVLSVCQLCLETSTPTSLQAGLLYILCDSLSSQVPNCPDLSAYGDENEICGVSLPMPLKSMSFMVDILRRAAQSIVNDDEPSPVPTLTSASVTVQILGFGLAILRILCAWDGNHGDRTMVTAVFLSHGLVELLAGLLEALGPPQAPGKGPPGGPLLEDRLPLRVGTFPRINPYQGYRRDIVAVIANISHENFLVQERVRENGSLLLVLQQCMVEKENPFLREWGLWAMRNLLEGNEKNQEEITDLEVKESVNLPELRKMGLNVEIDPSTRRPRLVNDNSST